RLVSLKHVLQSGDTIEVITSKNQTPSKDWLKNCVTTKAKSKIRQFVKTEQRKRALDLGREILDKAFRKAGASLPRALEKSEFNEFCKNQGCNGAEDLFIKVGYGTITPQLVLDGLHVESKSAPPPADANPGFIKRAFQAAISRTKKSGSLIKV